MTESAPNRRQQIIDAALHVFAEHGFDKATIKQIAKAADLKSPALLYWYFEDKDAVLQAVLERFVPLIGALAEPLQMTSLMKRQPRDILLLIADAYLHAFDNADAVNLFKIFITEAMKNSSLAAQVAEVGPVKVLQFITAYLNHQVELGSLRQHNSENVARAFLGALVFYTLSRHIVIPFGVNMSEAASYAEEIIDMFLDGLRIN